MDPVGLAVLVGVLAVSTVAGLLVRHRSGRLRTSGSTRGGWLLAGHDPAADERVLLLQLSSPVCAPCRQAAGVLAELAGRTPGLVHRELDVAERPDAARALGVMRTPTVVAFDRAGTELLRFSGVPRSAELRSALDAALGRS